MFTELFRSNNPDILFDAAIRGAVISSCSFVYIYPGEDGQPRFEVIPGADATGNLDLTTMLLTEGFAVLERDDFGQPSVTARFYDDATVIHYADGSDYVVKGEDIYLKSRLVDGVQHFVKMAMEYDEDIGWGATWGGDYILEGGNYVAVED